jgi:molecular chaperone DnaK (HSP70)
MLLLQQIPATAASSSCRCEVDPEQAVALGAAIQAAVLLGISSGLEMMDGSYVEEQHNRSTGF